MNLTKRRAGARSLATLGFGMILAGLSAAPAQALTASKGTDYLRTPTDGAIFKFDPPPIGVGPIYTLPYSGLPIRSYPMGGYVGQADTVVNRSQDVAATPAGGITPIEIVGLSLFAKNVSVPGLFVGPVDTIAGLQKYYPSTHGGGATSVGTMKIKDLDSPFPPPPGELVWDSEFTVKAISFFSTPGSLGLPDDPYAGTHSPDLVNNIISGITTPLGIPFEPYACDSGSLSGVCLLYEKTFTVNNQPWTTAPTPLTLTGPNLDPTTLVPVGGAQDFFISDIVLHDAGGDTIHTVTPFGVTFDGGPNPPLKNISSVPGPLPILGLGVAFSFSRRLKTKCQTAAKLA